MSKVPSQHYSGLRLTSSFIWTNTASRPAEIATCWWVVPVLYFKRSFGRCLINKDNWLIQIVKARGLSWLPFSLQFWGNMQTSGSDFPSGPHFVIYWNYAGKARDPKKGWPLSNSLETVRLLWKRFVVRCPSVQERLVVYIRFMFSFANLNHAWYHLYIYITIQYNINFSFSTCAFLYVIMEVMKLQLQVKLTARPWSFAFAY